MCCEPSHLGPPPEWHRELAGEVIREGRWAPSVPVAEGLAALASICHTNRPAGPRPASTEGGQGHALVTGHLIPGHRPQGVPVRWQDPAELDAYGPPVPEPNFGG